MAERIADAAMVVIARDGHDALSVRRVAAEVGVTGGTVQHHYPTKLELKVAALDRCVARQSARLSLRPRADDEVDGLIQRLGSLLPFDEDRRVETVVWIAMSAAVSGEPEIASRHRQAVTAMRRWIQATIERAQRSGDVPAAVDPGVAAQLIEAGLDGTMLAGISESYQWNRRARARIGVLVERLLLIEDVERAPREAPRRGPS